MSDEGGTRKEMGRMRIGAGGMRGRRLRAPVGTGTRPVLARIKKSVFDLLQPRMKGARVLDLFAGAGTFGLEALSRGAASVVLVEKGGQALAAIRDNVHALDKGAVAKVVPADAFALPEGFGGGAAGFDIMFIDPPFADSRDGELLEIAARLLGPRGVVVLRVPVGRALASRHAGLVMAREKLYGESRVGFYRRENPATGGLA